MTPTSRAAQAVLVRLQDLTPRCQGELVGRNREEVVLEYVRHSLTCPEGAGPIALDEMLEQMVPVQSR